jgi:hypothetical protein
MSKGSYKKFKLPGVFHSYDFPEPQPSLKEAKKWLRKWLNVKRLPSGVEIF